MIVLQTVLVGFVDHAEQYMRLTADRCQVLLLDGSHAIFVPRWGIVEVNEK